MRFRTKTILGVALIEIALLAMLVGSALSLLRDSNQAELTRRVQLGGRMLAAAAKDAVISQDLATLDSLSTEAMASGQIEYVRILDSTGAVLAQRGDAAMLARPFRVETRIDQVVDGIFDHSEPVMAGGIHQGEVRIGVSTEPLKKLVASAWRWAGGIAALEIALVALFSWLLGSYLARQLVALRQASANFAAGDFGHRVAVKGDDELAQTAQAFNLMAQQLGQSNELLRLENAKHLQAREDAETAGKLLREAVSGIALGFAIFDQADRLVHCNEAYRAFYASSRDLIEPGNSYESIVRHGAERGQYSDALGRVDDWVRECVAQHQLANGEVIEQQLNDGRWLLIVEYRTPSGYIVGNRIDITERRRMQQALAVSEQRWQLAVSATNDGIWDWNLQNDEVYFSPRWKGMLGYGVDEIGSTAHEWRSRLHPDEVAQVEAEVQRHLRGETEYFQSEHRMRCKNGDYKWILARGRVLLDAQGQRLRMLGSHSDISSRRAAEVREHEQSEQLKAIFTLSPDGFVSFDGARRVKYVSPAFERMTGLLEAAVLGLDEGEFSTMMADLCLPAAKFHGVRALRELPGSGVAAASSRVRETFELAASQRVLAVGLRVSQAPGVSQILYLRDITHESEVDRLKSEFLSTAAHELRTPMASIYGFAEVLLHQSLDEASRQEFLGIIFRQSEVMASILNELLDLARIEARRGKDWNFQPTSLQSLVDAVVRDYKPPEGRPAPVLDLQAAALTIFADEKKTQQAILNVLSNAYKYSPQGGMVTVCVFVQGEAGSALGPARSGVGVRISDQGIGMTAEQVQHVCERFYRADSSGKVPGTGLGMSIVKEIVELHRGVVLIDSRAGQGSSVTLLFPAIAQPA